jgi:predicted Zn finger-like uncharacterized protein
MIITCPNCDSEYDILETSLGESGRDVKCAKCDHKWFAAVEGGKTSDEEGVDEEIEEETLETPEEESKPVDEEEGQEDIQAETGNEESSENKEDEETVESEEEPKEAGAESPEEEIDIPESVKPIPDDAEVTAKPSVSLQEKMTGYGAALLIFGLLIVYIFTNKNQIIGVWPPSALFYEMAGVPAELKGENLVVETLSATVLKNRAQKDILVVKGRVVNLTEAPIDVPKMQASMRTTNGDEAERWIIDPPVKTIAAGESFAFTSDYPDVSNAIGSVNLAFIPTLKN